MFALNPTPSSLDPSSSDHGVQPSRPHAPSGFEHGPQENHCLLRRVSSFRTSAGYPPGGSDDSRR